MDHRQPTSSVADLSRKIIRYIRLYAKTAKPFHWKYTDIGHRIVPTNGGSQTAH